MRKSILEFFFNKLCNFVKYHLLTFPTFILQRVYRFDKWHIYGSSKPQYTFIVSQMLNQLTKKDTIVEIGCGLGNILKLARFDNKIGFDLDPQVIKAAKLTNWFRRIEFRRGTFLEATEVQDIDVLVAVNWVHNLESRLLVKELLNFPSCYIVTEGVEDYRFFHSREKFESNFQILDEVKSGNRHIYLLKKKS